MANDVSVRSYLQGQGVNNSDIGYDPNSQNVTVRGQNFIRPSANLAGTTYDSQQNLDNAYNNYSKTLPAIQPNGTTAYGASPTTGGSAGAGNAGQAPQAPTKPASTGYTNPYTQMIGDLIKHLSDTSNAPQTDIYSSPQYAAAKANQDKQSADAIRRASESAAGAGLGHSTIMTDRTQGIQNDANQQLATQLVPQIQAQLQQQRQQELTNQQNQLHDYMTLGQQADVQNNANRTFEAGRQDAATAATGIYNPTGQSVQDVQAQMDANSAAYPSASPAEKDRLHTENMQLAGLLGKNYDSGSGTYSQGQGFVGTKTIQAKQIEQALATGQINQETAQFKLDQLKDPNSPTNQAAQLDLQLKQIDLANAPQEARLKIQQLQKQIDQIGAAPYKSEADKQLDQVKLDTAREQLKQLQSKPASGNFNLDDYKGHINSAFYSDQPVDPSQPFGSKQKVFDKAGAQRYVDSLNLPTDQKNQLYQIYGLQAVSDSDISQYLK